MHASAGVLSKWYQMMYKALETHPNRTLNADLASLFFLGIDVGCKLNWPNLAQEPPSFNFAKVFIPTAINSCISAE